MPEGIVTAVDFGVRCDTRGGTEIAQPITGISCGRVSVVDYIVVGAGSAGCAAAARLSEKHDQSVLLLEQGARDLNPYIHIPATYFKVTRTHAVSSYQLEPIRGQNGRVQTMLQGNVLGGGSSVNGMVYVRGAPHDYDEWQQNGCAGWGYRDVLPFFKRAEDNDSLAGDAHGSGGPLGVSGQKYTHPLTKEWLKACQEFGMPYNPDFNSGKQEGCGLYQLTARGGLRSSSVSYLRQAKGRANLIVQTHVKVRRILFRQGRAVGVEYLKGGQSKVVYADREIILCAGAFGSPHLLLRSGVGPADHLRDVGVPVVHDLPGVGQNLQDHISLFMVYELNDAFSYDKYKKLRWQAWAGLQFGLFRSGPATSNIIEGGAFWYGDKAARFPDLQLFFFPGAGIEPGMGEVPSGNGCTIDFMQAKPKSRGTLRLRSSDPFSAPAIDPNYLAEEHDLSCLVEGVKMGEEIMRHPAIARYLRRCFVPNEKLETRRDYEEFVRREAQPGIHPTGTCKMGIDDMAVVDPRLRVQGIDGLRVADASIMPTVPSGNTNAPSIMIGERVADFIINHS